MNTDYRYKLETPRVTGRRQQKFQCPHCGRQKCFVRYVDTYNDYSYVSDEVGKCDHQNSCGYHYKPSDYYRDNAWLRDNPAKRIVPNPPKPKPLPPLQPLSMDLVALFHRPQSDFWQWFTTTCVEKLKLKPELVQQVYEDYRIGCTREGNVIFWQIDRHFCLRTGKIMRYGTDGHRIGNPKWVHSELIRLKLLRPDWPLYQCLFGEHLLAKYPDKTVCLVEGEKTACVMAAYMPQCLWLATGGCGGLTAEKLECLRGKKVRIFPDSGFYEKWKEKVQHITGIDYYIDASMESQPHNTDLCDKLLEEADHPP